MSSEPRSHRASVDERIAAGRELRKKAPRSSLAEWTVPADRPDPVTLLEEQSADRLPDLVPVRYGRMVSSAFAFYRGSAIVMAGDLAASPSPGITVQACGDAHLANLGVFATPERHIVFDLNDFDETLPGPFEWDVKRLAASFEIAGRHRGFDDRINRDAVIATLRSYQSRMRGFAAMRELDIWYSRLDADAILSRLKAGQRRRTERGLAKARLRDHLQAQSKLTELVDGRRRIKDQPPLLVGVGERFDDDFVRSTLEDYAGTLSDARAHLLSRYRPVDVALKVVGVGSVGTRCLIVLLEGRDDGDPLFLQIKEANASVLEGHAEKSRYANHAQRVVEGQRMTQVASDIFLGWIEGRGEEHRHFYLRQLRDVKGSADLETIRPVGLVEYGQVCGAALAQAHARSGDAATITGYIGAHGAFASAVAEFARAYADQTEGDHAALVEAVRSGRVSARGDL